MKDRNLPIALAAIEQLNIKPEMEREIINNVKYRMASAQRVPRSRQLRPLMTGAAMGILVLIAVGVPVSAYVFSVVKERMEQMPAEEITAIVETIDSQPVDADSFSRDYTETEVERMSKLRMAYQNGTFPAGKLTQVESAAEAGRLEIYFLTPTSYFQLPAREMTDEELLQIIDFNTQRDYALLQRQEEMPAEESDPVNEARKDQAVVTPAEVFAQGGLNETSATETATAWLKSIFGVTEDGREINCYLDGDPAIRLPYIPLSYVVTFSVQAHEYHYLCIDAMDGTLKWIMYSNAASLELDRLPGSVVTETKIREIKETAANFLTRTLGINEEYQNIYCRYNLEQDLLSDNLLEIQFVKADGEAYLLSYNLAADELSDYLVANYAEYTETLAAARQSREDWEAQRREEGLEYHPPAVEKIIKLQ